MTEIDKLMEEREKITKKIDKIRSSENLLKLETASKYTGRCFSNKRTENIKIVGCRVCGCVVFEVLSFSTSRADGDILWYDEYKFSSVVGNKNWEEIPISEFVKSVKDEVQKILEG